MPAILHCATPATPLYLGHYPGRVVFSSSGLGRLENVLQYAAESLFSVLIPSDCRICNSPLINISRLPVCRTCLEQIKPFEGVVCSVCGERLFGHHFESEAGPLCGLCHRAAPPFRRAVAYGAYEGALRDLLHLFKYQQIRPAGEMLAQLLAQAVGRLGVPDSVLVIPVPLWPGKRESRGFNQAEDIARTLARSRTGTRIQLDTHSLVRQRDTASQTGLTRHQRRANVRGAFAATRRDRVRGRSVLLIDDVMTTGTTAGECARVLLRAGAKEVFVATVARATREAAVGLPMAGAARAGG
jgi:ComF family protein